ncbi:MAG: uL15m family ribosomal protein [Halobacteriales archaeon]
MSRDSKKRGRGSRTHGGGTQKNRRGAGHRGGRGEAGRKKHEAKNHPQLGKTGFKRPQKVVEDIDVSNVGDIDREVDTLVERGVAEETDGGYVVDASALGVDKVLGSGQVRNTLTVRADNFSDSAVEKIEDAGGEVVVTSEDDVDETEEDE